MTYLTWKIERIPYEDNEYSGSAETITSFYQPELRMNIGTGKDSFSFKVNNFNNNFGNKFKSKDKILISRVRNTEIVGVDDIKMVGTITDIPETNNQTNDLLRVKGYNFSESLMNAIIFVDPVSSGFTIPQLLQQALISVQANNPAFAVTWSSSNPSLKKDGSTSFPLVKDRFYYKTAKEVIEKYSTNRYTEDGNYYWYINNNNEFIWRPNLDNVSYEFDSTIDEYKSYKISKDTKDVKNFVIVKGGLDPKGKPIQQRYQDFVSSAKHGLRYKLLVDETSLAQTRNEADMVKAGDSNKEYGTLPSNIPGFTYPFTATWIDVETGAIAICSSEEEYVLKLRANIKQELLKIATAYVENRQFGKIKVDIQFLAASKGWGLGDVVNITIPNLSSDDNTTSKTLRVMDINFGSDTDTYSLEEDIGTI